MAENETPPAGEKSVVPQGVKKKLGPLPIWLWVVGIAGAVGLGLYLRSRGSGPGSSTVGAAIPATPGTVSGDPNSLGTNFNANDPMSHADLLSAIQSLAAQAGANGGSGLGNGINSILGRASQVPSGGYQADPGSGSISTTHTTGGQDTQNTAFQPRARTPLDYSPPAPTSYTPPSKFGQVLAAALPWALKAPSPPPLSVSSYRPQKSGPIAN